MDNQIVTWGILSLFALNLLIFLVVLLKVLKFDKQKSEATLVMTPTYMAELEKQTRDKFTQLIDQSSQELNKQLEQKMAAYLNALEHGLKDPDAQINQTVERLLHTELKAYQHDLKSTREKLLTTINQVGSEIAVSQQQAKAEISTYIEKEKSARLARIDEKLTDILAQYLISSLGSEIDFASQRDYIYHRLEANKENLRQDILNAS